MGEPVAFGVGFLVFLLVCFSAVLARYPITLAHEGGHMFANLATLRGNKSWKLKDDADGATEAVSPGNWLQRLIVTFVGYPAPPLLGLGAAALIDAGNPWAVLLGTVFLSVLAVALSTKGLAFLIPALIAIGVAWALLAGSASVQAAVAVGIAWWLLLGGLLRIIRVLGGSSDATRLAEMTFIPKFVWSLVWLFIGVVSLIVGGQLLLRPGYGIG
ncbi:M50 family metallopeptidase [Actinomycetospora rhizophila]|uniref:M50 family metallopeptidase n=1 Tax=Actinomycetospora rhizophila TaxID=1416876 RepID=A0ABV9ZGP4_9PSEU